MKQFISATLIALFSVVAFAGEPVLVQPTGVPGFKGRPNLAPALTVVMKWSMNGGLHANFAEKSVSVMSDGTVVYTMDYYGAKQESKLVATLSADALAGIVAKIAVIKADTPLITENTGGPSLDTPYEQMTITKDGEEMVISSEGGGKTSYLQYHEGNSLVQILEGLSLLL